MPSRRRDAIRRGMSLGLLVVLLAGAAGVGWWMTSTREQIRREVTGLAETIPAVQNIMTVPHDLFLLPDMRGLDPAARAAADQRLAEFENRASVYQAFEALDAAELTFEERALRKPLRLAVDDYYAASSKAAEFDRQNTGTGGLTARNPWQSIRRDHGEQVRELSDRLLVSLEARNAALNTDLRVAGVVGRVAFAVAAVLTVLTGVLVVRWVLRRRSAGREKPHRP
ncbi:hypothetical protein BJY16_007113 [Actinoplanes octamycinicus]|uniref:Chemoreceptor-like protein with four helix bundle sensory module n=1 Tax=Actinoplanes octamycinicus TaxID=135948 RepID=A0A7W7H4H4_9ACTN|nr:hypothetical protein [Actinoplanes octamycinicus]MBB4743654.1 hypothetical protein [Actinoplanes octamycinicus]GIE61080.1 hypothetical protein Aoc01nite_64820 [Actinoplanes octamycinicus]